MGRPRTRRWLIATSVVSIASAGAACASGGGSGEGGLRNPNVIEAEELASIPTLTAMDAIRRLRPRWLQPRGQGGLPIVFRDGARLDRPDDLRRIQVAEVQRLEYLSPSDATMKYGTNFVGGAIEVTSRAR